MVDIEQCFQILDLENGASPEAVENAYRELSKVWHPDRFLKESPSLQQKAREKQREINQAYERLQVYQSEQLPAESPEKRRGSGVDAADVRVVESPPIPDESTATKVSRFVSDWVGPILRKVVEPSEPRQESPGIRPEKSSRSQPRSQWEGKGRGRGRGSGRASGQKQERGRGRGPRCGRNTSRSTPRPSGC